MKLEIVLVRHGYSQGNKENRLSGWTDVELTDEGIRDLHLLKNRFNYPETDLYFSSDLKRAYDTAQIIYPNKEINKLTNFREINFGIYENKGPKDINLRDFFEQWFTQTKIEGGENFNEFKNRILSSFHSLNNQMLGMGHKSYTIVCHSGIIRLIYLYCFKKDQKEFFRIPVPNGLGYVLNVEYDSDKFVFNDIKPICSIQ